MIGLDLLAGSGYAAWAHAVILGAVLSIGVCLCFRTAIPVERGGPGENAAEMLTGSGLMLIPLALVDGRLFTKSCG